jgi:short-subunit dehydrogenase
VNMSSLAGKVSAPFNAPYSMSKYALEAYSDALRRELEPTGIQVAVVEPGAIDTPIWGKARERIVKGRDQWPEGFEERYGKLFDHGLENFKDRQGISPEYVAKAVQHALTAKRPKIRYVIGMDARILFFLNHWLPDRWMDRLFRHAGKE